jgi:hypothetical protein
VGRGSEQDPSNCKHSECPEQAADRQPDQEAHANWQALVSMPHIQAARGQNVTMGSVTIFQWLVDGLGEGTCSVTHRHSSFWMPMSPTTIQHMLQKSGA